MSTKIKSPTYPESVEDGVIAKWVVKEGQDAKQDDVIAEIETDKVVIEVVAPNDGTLTKIIKDEGEVVISGELIAEFESGEIALENKKNETKKPNKTSKKLESNTKKVTKKRTSKSQREEKRVPMSRIRKTVADRLVNVQQETAMLTTFNEVDMSSVMKIRSKFKEVFEKKHNVKLGFMSFFVKACCHALNEVPEVNAQIDEDHLVFHQFVNMGVAVGTPTGLVVPVIKNADKMSFAEVEKSISNLGKKARDGKLSMDDMKGGTFTISNGGVYGSLMSSPILNYPQSGILGMHKIQERPIAIDGNVVIKPMMYLALSYDHRIVDGKGAVTFLVRVKEMLEDPHRLLMDV